MTVITSPVTSVLLDGSPLDLDTVEWSVIVSHGRTDIAGSPQPSTARLTLTLRSPDVLPDAIARTLEVESHSTPRFTGEVTGMRIEHATTADDVDPRTRVHVYAVGNLNKLATLTDGAAGFIEETMIDRATGILDATGLTYAISSDDGTVLLAHDPETRTVLDWLNELCETVGATMADLPDGTILFESYTRRSLDFTAGIWAGADGTWADYAGQWQAGRATLALPAESVMWAPQWEKAVDTVLNDVTVTYGAADPQTTVTAGDSNSVTRYGTRSVELVTTIKLEAAAQARADAIITAQASARWRMSQVTVLVDTLDATDLALLLALESGDRVNVDGNPGVSPATAYVGIVEGWTDTYSPSGHRMTLYLSDPRFSFALADWGQIDTAVTWADVNATVAWSDIVLPADIL